jgi:hypothetical protein
MIFDRRRLATLPGLLLLVAPVIVGCSGNDAVGGPSSGLMCIDDSSDCVTRRQKTLRILIEDEDRTWVKARPPAEAYASGVRLFALKSKKKDLSCDELAHARNEADRAPAILRGPQGAKFTPAQVSRGVMLASEVSRELGTEMRRRCGKS